MSSSLEQLFEPPAPAYFRHIRDKTTFEEILLKDLAVPTGPGELENGDKATSSYDGYTREPRVDGGRDAWLFLVACFVLEALIWGFSFSFGVFQAYYAKHPVFGKNPSGIAAIGTSSLGVMYLMAPVTLTVLEAFPRFHRWCSVVGLVISALALILSSFATQIWHLIITQGVMYAVGGSLLYAPTMFYLDQWFEKRKGLAFGVMWSGVGASGLVFPFALKVLLDTWGFEYTLRIWSIILVFLCAPLVYFIKPRVPVPSPPPPYKRSSYTFLFKPTFILLQLSNILESFGFFMPAIFLPTYASYLNLSAHKGVIVLALLNLFSVVGAIGFGFLCDKMHISHVIAISTFGSTLSVFVFWGPASEIRRLVIFAMVYGSFAGGYSALWAGMMKEVQKVRGCETASMGVLMGMFAAGRGLGAVASGPISEILLKKSLGGIAKGFASDYGAIMVFTGASAAAGGVGFFVTRRMRDQPEREDGTDGNDGDSVVNFSTSATRR
ncbi:related to monocarboxylate transporter 2 [Rhynchosporium secalis]|uniref:Related to monocarboxylate transporter 2 n=1 Tax=Rhynchosporium secalis TaxID=38038 RepID=A0A1E1M9W9_RHYSE|nr:related to monocarboxylate transporter 2 [Rhynchosporium secalis]